jgi:hypothetical protein
MNDALISQRIDQILRGKIAMGAGCEDCGMEDYIGEGRRHYRRKRAPSAHNRRVAAYIRKHGVTLGEASHALRGSGVSAAGYHRRRAPIRRRRAGGVLLGGTDYESKLDAFEDALRGSGVSAAGYHRRRRAGGVLLGGTDYESKLDAFEDARADKKLAHQLACAAPPKHASEAEISRWLRDCNLSKANLRKKAYKQGIRATTKTAYDRYLANIYDPAKINALNFYKKNASPPVPE